jgi:hypothetical protein
MPQQRMDIRMIKDILRLKYSAALSHEAIARSLGISKGVVAKYLGLAGAAGLDWATVVDLDEVGLERRLFGRSIAETQVVEADFARVHSLTPAIWDDGWMFVMFCITQAVLLGHLLWPAVKGLRQEIADRDAANSKPRLHLERRVSRSK